MYENGVPDTISIDRAKHASCTETLAKIGEEEYVSNDGTTLLAHEANDTNKLKPLQSNVSNDDRTETLKAKRIDVNKRRKPNDRADNNGDVRYGPEETEIL